MVGVGILKKNYDFINLSSFGTEQLGYDLRGLSLAYFERSSLKVLFI